MGRARANAQRTLVAQAQVLVSDAGQRGSHAEAKHPPQRRLTHSTASSKPMSRRGYAQPTSRTPFHHLASLPTNHEMCIADRHTHARLPCDRFVTDLPNSNLQHGTTRLHDRTDMDPNKDNTNDFPLIYQDPGLICQRTFSPLMIPRTY